MEKMEFAGQNRDEEVELVTKQHPWYFIVSAIKIIDLWLIFILIFHFFWGSWPSSYALLIILPWSIYILSSSIFFWTNTLYLLTNQRLIVVEQEGWFSRVVSETSLGNIMFISHKIQGPVETMYNFGSIHVRASGVTEEEIVLALVSDPYDVQQKIVAAQKRISDRDNKDTHGVMVQNETKENKNFWKK